MKQFKCNTRKWLTYSVTPDIKTPRLKIYYGVDISKMIGLVELSMLMEKATPALPVDIIMNILDFNEAGWLPGLSKEQRLAFYQK